MRCVPLPQQPDVIVMVQPEAGMAMTMQLGQRPAEPVLQCNIFPVGRITEDPATGSAAAATGAYLRELGRVPAGAVVRIRQGEPLDQPDQPHPTP